MRRWSDIRCGCERQGDTKSAAAPDAHPKQSTKQWRQVAFIGESSLSRTQFSSAKEGGSCLRTSAPHSALLRLYLKVSLPLPSTPWP